jgi:uncharacterized protein YebE (UPF0316 family)
MIEISLTPAAWLGALLIFVLRIGDMSLDTIRLLYVVRGHKLLAWLLGFFQSLIFVVAIANVLTGKASLLSILAYALGFATGNVIGMLIEEKLAIGHIRLTVVSTSLGSALADKLRRVGYAVTEVPARGKNGTVSMLSCSVRRREFDNAETIILEVDPEAFITAEDVRAVRRGFWRA